MDEAFPTILQRMRNVTIEWALVHGVIRQESSFDYAATSSAGARGLMQLMPSTAAVVARKIGVANRPDLLATPDYNVKLGSAYLKQLLDKYNGSYPLALAAYNGGPARVDRWLSEIGDPRRGKVDVVDWIEQIPIAETRNYVQRVMEAVYIYRLKLRGVQTSFNTPRTFTE
jgi:soluble lytic murein transglycosylase